ncbi:MAG: hypothetical protein ACM3TN_24590 [Alphaproteobacteria bacterium]
MILTKFPQLPTQQAEHANLLNTLEHRADDYRRAPDRGEQVSDFLFDWFVIHTQIEDRKIAAYVGRAEKAAP